MTTTRHRGRRRAAGNAIKTRRESAFAWTAGVMRRAVFRFLAVVIGGALVVGHASSAFAASMMTIVATEETDGVLFTYSGGVDLTGLPEGTPSPGANSGLIAPSSFGPAGVFQSFVGGYEAYAFNVPNNLPVYGTGGFAGGTPTGDTFGIASGFVFVPTNYVSEDLIEGSLFIPNRTFSNLGMFVMGTFETTLDNGSIVSLSISDPGAPIPLPPAALLFLPLAAGAVLRRRKA